MSFCEYSNLFGEPNTGVHSTRLFGIAIYDFVFTVIAVIILSWLFGISFWCLLIIVLLLGVILHRMFCVRTAVDKWLFP